MGTQKLHVVVGIHASARNRYDVVDMELVAQLAFAASAAGVRGWFMLADIDYLKVINDKYGHLVGDDAVVSVAQAMVNVLPTDSLIARIGGDEFCAFISKASCADVDGAIEQMNAKAHDEFQQRQTGITHVLSLSVGYMPLKSKQKFKDIMSLADERMYRKKRAR